MRPHSAGLESISLERELLGSLPALESFSPCRRSLQLVTRARRCRARGPVKPVGGVLVLGDAEGTLEECSIYDNGYSGVSVRQSARPLIRNCKITGNAAYAVVVHDGASANVEDCDLTANRSGAWEIQPQCEVRKARNKE